MPDSFDFSRKPVLVLGGSGYIGSRVAAALAGNVAYRPVVASRRSAVPVDATSLDSMQRALGDVDCVINCVAGKGDTMVKATQVLCDAARLSPPRRIVHLSSMSVYGEATGTVREDDPPVEPMRPYGRAKLECERIVRKYVADGGEAVILRPTCVFGPASPQWATRIIRLLRTRRAGDLGPAGDGRCNLAFIDDVVAGIVSSLDAPNVSGRAFNISSDSTLRWNEFLIAFGRALGFTPIRRIPERTLRIETKLLALPRRLARSEAITPSLAALWRQDILVDCSAAQAELSLPQTPVNQMISAVLRETATTKEPAVL